MPRLIVLAACLAACVAVAAPAFAQDTLSVAERRVILDYFSRHKAPDRTDAKPALDPRLEVGAKLPPNTVVRPLPEQLADALPGRRIVIVDDEIVLLAPDEKVLDVLIDGARG